MYSLAGAAITQHHRLGICFHTRVGHWPNSAPCSAGLMSLFSCWMSAPGPRGTLSNLRGLSHSWPCGQQWRNSPASGASHASDLSPQGSPIASKCSPALGPRLPAWGLHGQREMVLSTCLLTRKERITALTLLRRRRHSPGLNHSLSFFTIGVHVMAMAGDSFQGLWSKEGRLLA